MNQQKSSWDSIKMALFKKKRTVKTDGSDCRQIDLRKRIPGLIVFFFEYS